MGPPPRHQLAKRLGGPPRQGGTPRLAPAALGACDGNPHADSARREKAQPHPMEHGERVTRLGTCLNGRLDGMTTPRPAAHAGDVLGAGDVESVKDATLEGGERIRNVHEASVDALGWTGKAEVKATSADDYERSWKPGTASHGTGNMFPAGAVVGRFGPFRRHPGNDKSTT